jgi:hypothetical protein
MHPERQQLAINWFPQIFTRSPRGVLLTHCRLPALIPGERYFFSPVGFATGFDFLREPVFKVRLLGLVRILDSLDHGFQVAGGNVLAFDLTECFGAEILRVVG